MYQHAGQGQGTIQESDLPVPGVSDSIEANNDNGAILAYSETSANEVGMNVQRNRRHSNGFAVTGQEPA